MAIKRPPKFSGRLSEPIYEPIGGGVLGLPSQENVETRIFDRQFDKLFLLLDHYKIDRESKNCWILLSFRLANDFVPGMQVVDAPPTKAGRKRTWKAGLGADLLDDVEKVRQQHNMPISGAIQHLQRSDPKWKRYTPQNLETRRREAHRERLIRRRAMVNLLAIGRSLSLPNLADADHSGAATPLWSGLFGLGAAAKLPPKTDGN